MHKIVIIIFAISCSSFVFGETIEERKARFAKERGTLKGTVIEKVSKKPLENVGVSTQYVGDQTDKEGNFSVINLNPGITEITIWRPDLKSEKFDAKIIAGEVTKVTLEVEYAPLPCCLLYGEWEIELQLKIDEKNLTTKGIVIFNEKRENSGSILHEYGKYNIKLSELFGEDELKATSNTFFKGKNKIDPMTEVLGYVYNNNHVEIIFIPRSSHIGLSLNGSIDGNTLTGEWVKREYAPKYWGTFTMKRLENVH